MPKGLACESVPEYGIERIHRAEPAVEENAAKYKQLLAREKLNIRSPEEVALWTETLDIYTADLVSAVAEVGDSAAKVFEFLQKRGIAGNRSRG